jgi:hypothetical protein
VFETFRKPRIMRHPTVRFPDYPPLVAPPEVRSDLLPLLSGQIALNDRHDPYNGFKVEGEERWGRPARFRLAEIRASHLPFEGAPAEETRFAAVHLLFVTEKGEIFGVNRCRPSTLGTEYDGVLIPDRKGRVWFCGERADPDAPAPVLTGSERLFPVPVDVAPIFAETALKGAPLTDRLPASGRFNLGSQGELLWADRLDQVDPTLYARISERVTALVDREGRIRRAAERHFGEGSLDGLLLGRDFPVTGGLIPAYHEFDARKAFDAELFRVTRGFLEALRAEGLVEPCPNNGPRGVGPLAVWNRWLSGAYDAPPETRDLEDRYGEHELAEAPGFKTVRNCLVRAVVDMGKRVWEREHPGERWSADSRDGPIGREDAAAALRDACARIITSYADEASTDTIGSMDLRGSLTGEAYGLAGSFLTPVLCEIGTAYTLEPVPLPPLEAPKSVRHLELSLPSGVLCMADWFRIKGFKEGLQALIGGDDHYEINYATGLDARARDYFEKAGLAIVQVGNTSPHAYADTPGVWRMGHVDEDHEAFWTEEGERRDGAQPPQEAWRTCTDLWANTFADREVILDILMASKRYPDRSDARAALDAYAEEYGVSMVNLGVDHLHLYVPTGYGVRKGGFNDVFRAEELKVAEWREDAYVLSAAPLTVDPELLEACDWRERPRPTGEMSPEP